jgi:hypothetical protein
MNKVDEMRILRNYANLKNAVRQGKRMLCCSSGTCFDASHKSSSYDFRPSVEVLNISSLNASC